MKSIRFRCPACRMCHAVARSRAGEPFACSCCFSPMIIPEPAARATAEIPFAYLIEVPRRRDEATSSPDAESRLAVQPRRSMEPIREEPIEPSVPPEPTLIDEIPLEIKPSTVPLGRIVMALSGVVVLILAVFTTSTILGSGKKVQRDQGDHKVEVAIVQGPVEPLAPVPAPAVPVPTPNPPVDPDPTSEVKAPVAIEDVPKARIEPAPKVEVPAPEPTLAPVDQRRPLVIRRRQMLGQEALRRQLAESPELKLSHHTEAGLLASLGLATSGSQTSHAPTTRRLIGQPGFLGPAFAGQQHSKRATHDDGIGMHVAHGSHTNDSLIVLLKRKQPELAHLQWRTGDECRLSREAAEELQIHSLWLREMLSLTIPEGDTRPDPDTLREILLPGIMDAQPERLGFQEQLAKNLARANPRFRSDVPSAIPALMQLLMAERTPTRLVLIDLLARIPGPESSKAMARLAMFDLAPEVRERALTGLRERPALEYRNNLLEGLRYPWAPVADHAAEALVALEDRQAIPTLVGLLDEPDPQTPRTEVQHGQPVTFVKTVVQVNHLRNCLLCHAPSTNPTTDLVRGRVPTEGVALNAPPVYYGGNGPGEYVRAEITYLRQDFSVTQPVERAAPWPAYQRYDYLISERPVSNHRPLDQKRKPEEKVPEKAMTDYPQRESVLFALRELTGKDFGEESASWKAEVLPKPPAD